MLNVLVNAYSVSPAWGSEPGMGWNWVVNLAQYCNVFVITEGEWRTEIEETVEKLPQRGNLHFYFNPVSERVRRMCWNQGDWRFYWHYRKWQKRTLAIARQIIARHRIDIIHQLNMIGFREPGYLWKISNIPFVWGPVGGMEMMPLAYLEGEPAMQSFKVCLKNSLNNFQRHYQPRLLKVLDRADAIVAATKGVYDFISEYHQKSVTRTNETCCYVGSTCSVDTSGDKKSFDILWVGKFDFRKQLGLALKIIATLPDKQNVKLHIVGNGTDAEKAKYKQLATELGINDIVVWHGSIPHDRVLQFMRQCDLFLFTSIMEGTPHVVLEAIQNSLPVVCFDACGQAGAVNDRVGVKIPLSNPQQSINDFASAIMQLSMDRERLRTMRLNCQERQTELAWEKKAQQMVEIYHKVKR